MTREHDFKSKVRARMAKTGERYAAARARLVAESAPATAPRATAGRALGGVHPETVALMRLAAAAGKPVSEAMALGLGGGIGGAYFVFEYKGAPPTFYVATRCYPQYAYGPEFIQTAAKRLGLELEISHSTSKPVAARKLIDAVATQPVIAWADRSSLPWPWPMAGGQGAMPHVVVVTAAAGDAATVFDTGPAPFHLPLAALAAARARDRKSKHRMIRATGFVEVDPAAATLEAIRSCVAELGGRTRHRNMAGNFGVPGLAKWAALLDDAKDKKGWPRVFARGGHMWSALTWGYHWIVNPGAGGGFRGLYADFLDEARAITGRPALGAVAARYRALSATWVEVSHAMLPATIPLLAETRAALDDRVAALRRGDPGIAAATAAQARVGALRARADAGELDAQVEPVRRELAIRVRRLVADEDAARRELAAAVA